MKNEDEEGLVLEYLKDLIFYDEGFVYGEDCDYSYEDTAGVLIKEGKKEEAEEAEIDGRSKGGGSDDNEEVEEEAEAEKDNNDDDDDDDEEFE